VTPWIVLAAALLQTPQPAAAQPGQRSTGEAARRVDVSGQVAVLGDWLPRRDTAEVRASAGLEFTARPAPAIRLKLDGFAEALAADRGGATSAAGLRVREAWLELTGGRGDFRAGFGRIVWGRLDEVQPSDVINPLDTARFLLDGRSAARLPVAFARGRWFVSDRLSLESVIAPVFRRGTFDELDESSSPFNLLADVTLPAVTVAPDVRRLEPSITLSNTSGGGRVSATFGRVDVAAAVYRGFDGFGPITFEIDVPEPGEPPIGPAVVGRLVERFPRFTMISGDFEAVAGEWAWRGEAAVFVEKTFGGVTVPGLVRGKALDAGVGFDRRSGDYRVFGSVIVHRQWSEADAAIGRTDVSFVASVERQFRRERYLARAFTVINPGAASGFVRGLLIWRVQDNVALEFSAAAFAGEGEDTLSRFRTRDFLLARARWMF
jgi:hypothetical protein